MKPQNYPIPGLSSFSNVTQPLFPQVRPFAYHLHNVLIPYYSVIYLLTLL